MQLGNSETKGYPHIMHGQCLLALLNSSISILIGGSSIIPKNVTLQQNRSLIEPSSSIITALIRTQTSGMTKYTHTLGTDSIGPSVSYHQTLSLINQSEIFHPAPFTPIWLYLSEERPCVEHLAQEHNAVTPVQHAPLGHYVPTFLSA